MTHNFWRTALVSATSLVALSALAMPAWAIHPMGFRMMPVFRITPAMNGMMGNGMMGTMNGMRMSPTFNVQTGFVAMPRFGLNHERSRFDRMELRNLQMMNGMGNSFSSGIGYSGMSGGVGSYPSMSSGNPGNYGQMTSTPAFANDSVGGNAPDVSRILTAAGLPNDQGQLNWPLGLQALFPATANLELIQQLDASLQTAALQKEIGSVDSEVIKGARRDAGKLRAMLLQREPYLQAITYREADRFLKNLDSALKQLEGNTTASATK
jgi:hypothetical protein